jgi:hypothetical protein
MTCWWCGEVAVVGARSVTRCFQGSTPDRALSQLHSSCESVSAILLRLHAKLKLRQASMHKSGVFCSTLKSTMYLNTSNVVLHQIISCAQANQDVIYRS